MVLKSGKRVSGINLFHPARLYNRFRFGQLFRSRSRRLQKFKKNLLQLSSNNNYREYDNDKLSSKFEEFLRYGGVVIQNYFPEDQIQQFLNKYRLQIKLSIPE